MNKLEVKNISKSFGDNNVLKDISIELNQGELVCLLGISGSGKTTLFNIISGLVSPDDGQVLLDGEDITNRSGHISYMLQKDLLLPYRTIEDNVALPLLLKGEKKKAARNRVSPLFSQFGLEGTQKKYPSQLSGGMRQRAALLRTYMFSKDVALLDEPFSALDALTRETMQNIVLELCEQQNLTLVLVTHNIEEAIFLGQKIAVFSDNSGIIRHVADNSHSGEISYRGTEEFYQHCSELRGWIGGGDNA